MSRCECGMGFSNDRSLNQHRMAVGHIAPPVVKSVAPASPAAPTLTKDETIAALRAALQAASDHLDYCGYGDSWERECAESNGLPAQIAAALQLPHDSRSEL